MPSPIAPSASATPGADETRKVMYIDMSHPYDRLLKRGQTAWLKTRDSGGYFKKIWSVHPIADVGGSGSHKLETHAFEPDHIVVEGVSRSRPHWPRFLAPLDFLLSQLQLIRHLMRIIRDEEVSLIIATDPLYGGLLGRLLRRLCRVPLVVAVYGNFALAYRLSGILIMPRLFPSYRLQEMVTGIAFRGADWVVANSHDNINYAISAGADPQHTTVTPYGKMIQDLHFRDPETRRPLAEVRDRLGLPEADDYVIMVSRLAPIKFAEDGVRAMKVVVEGEPGAIAIVAGDGPLRAELEALVRSWGLEQRILFPGNIAQENLSSLVPHCVSLSPLTGMALIEAGLGGSPIVAYDLEWQSEFVADGETGFVVPHRDHQSMGAKALHLIRNGEVRREFAARIRARTLDYADRDRIAAIEQVAFGNLIEQHAARRAGRSPAAHHSQARA